MSGIDLAAYCGIYVQLNMTLGMAYQVVHDHFANMSTSVIAILMFLVSQKNVTRRYLAPIRNKGHIPHYL